MLKHYGDVIYVRISTNIPPGEVKDTLDRSLLYLKNQLQMACPGPHHDPVDIVKPVDLTWWIQPNNDHALQGYDPEYQHYLVGHKFRWDERLARKTNYG